MDYCENMFMSAVVVQTKKSGSPGSTSRLYYYYKYIMIIYPQNAVVQTLQDVKTDLCKSLVSFLLS